MRLVFSKAWNYKLCLWQYHTTVNSIYIYSLKLESGTCLCSILYVWNQYVKTPSSPRSRARLQHSALRSWCVFQLFAFIAWLKVRVLMDIGGNLHCREIFPGRILLNPHRVAHLRSDVLEITVPLHNLAGLTKEINWSKHQPLISSRHSDSCDPGSLLFCQNTDKKAQLIDKPIGNFLMGA